MPRRDPETGLFMSGTPMTDGGVPGGIVEEAYHGDGAYTDYENVAFKVEDLVRNAQASPQQISENVSPLFEATEFLDRREEMADLIHAQIRVTAACVLPDDNVAATQRDASAMVALTTGQDDIGLGNVDFPTLFSSEQDVDVSTQVDSIGRILTVHPQYGFEDGANSSGGGSTPDHDKWSQSAHEITADPTFDERDEVDLEIFVTQDQNINVYLQITGLLTFGLFELQEQEVKR